MISAIAVAIQMIDTATTGKSGNRLKFDRRVIIVTDGYGYMDTGDLNDVVQKLKADEIEVTLL